MNSINQNNCNLLLLLVVIICVFFFAKSIVGFFYTIRKVIGMGIFPVNDDSISALGDILKLLCIVAFGYICWLLYRSLGL